MKKIFVTGGGGFIGSHLVEKLLNQNYKVTVLVEYEINNRWGWIDTFKKEYKDKLEVVIGDIRDFNLILWLKKNPFIFNCWLLFFVLIFTVFIRKLIYYKKYIKI